MLPKILVVVLIYGFSVCYAQYTSQTYPDPRIDPLNCRMTLPGPVCDPNGIMPQNERMELADKINKV